MVLTKWHLDRSSDVVSCSYSYNTLIINYNTRIIYETMKTRLGLRIPVSWDVKWQSGSRTSKETCNILPYPRSPECSIILLWKLQTLERHKWHAFFHVHMSTLYTKMQGYRIFGKKSNMQGVNSPLLTKTIYWRFRNKIYAFKDKWSYHITLNTWCQQKFSVQNFIKIKSIMHSAPHNITVTNE